MTMIIIADCICIHGSLGGHVQFSNALPQHIWFRLDDSFLFISFVINKMIMLWYIFLQFCSCVKILFANLVSFSSMNVCAVSVECISLASD